MNRTRRTVFAIEKRLNREIRFMLYQPHEFNGQQFTHNVDDIMRNIKNVEEFVVTVGPDEMYDFWSKVGVRLIGNMEFVYIDFNAHRSKDFVRHITSKISPHPCIFISMLLTPFLITYEYLEKLKAYFIKVHK